MITGKRLTVLKLTGDTWEDFEKLFGPKGACAGCWCMYWRLPGKAWKSGQGAGNKKKMKALVKKNALTGLILYLENKPIGWCSLGPRENFPVLNNSKVLARVDDKPVWSIVCFFIDKVFRKQGLSARFLEEVINFARQEGATILEGYPVLPNKENYPSTFAFTGFYSTFKKAGFKQVAKRSPTRPVMRYFL